MKTIVKILLIILVFGCEKPEKEIVDVSTKEKATITIEVLNAKSHDIKIMQNGVVKYNTTTEKTFKAEFERQQGKIDTFDVSVKSKYPKYKIIFSKTRHSVNGSVNTKDTEINKKY